MVENPFPYAHDLSTSDENPPRIAEYTKLDRDFDFSSTSSGLKKIELQIHVSYWCE